MESQKQNMQKDIKSDKYLSRMLVGISLIVLGIVFIVIALNQPKENINAMNSNVSVSVKDTAEYSAVRTETNSSEKVVDYSVTNSVTHSAAKSESDKSVVQNSETVKSSNAVSFPINLNKCTAEDLMAIDNIGEARANAIIAYREYLGGYTSVEQLKNISGIGETVFSYIAPYVTV